MRVCCLANGAVSPIGTANQAFLNSYNGHSYRLEGNSVSGNQHVAFFGYNKGSLSNIVLLSGTNIKTINGQNYVGSLVGTNEGRIYNCVAAGFALSSGNGPIGGFVGLNKGGTIENCAAVSYTSDGCGGSITGGHSVGGFVGENSNSGSIQGCYAIATNTAAANNDQQKGFAGSNSANIYSCYCAVISNSGAYLEFGSGGNDCYAYKHGEASSAAIIKNKLAWESADAEHSHPFGASFSGACPWPTSLKDESGRAVYYGNWMQ